MAKGRFVSIFGSELIVRDEKSGNTIWKKDLSGEGGWLRNFIIADGLVVALVEPVDLEESRRKLPRRRYVNPIQSLIAWSLDAGNEVWRYDGEELWEGVDYPSKGLPSVYGVNGYRNGMLPFIVWDAIPNFKNHAKNGVVMLLDVKTGKPRWARPSYNIERTGGWRVRHFIANEQLHVTYLTHLHRSFDINAGQETKTTSFSRAPRTSNCCTGTATARYLCLQRNYIPRGGIERMAASDVRERMPDLFYSRLFSLACNAKITPA